jgi:hypothetical protein
MSPDRRRTTGSGVFVLLGLLISGACVLVAAGSPGEFEIPGATAERVFTTAGAASSGAIEATAPDTRIRTAISTRSTPVLSGAQNVPAMVGITLLAVLILIPRSPAVRWGASRSSGPRAPPWLWSTRR